jgi:AcrR family transcriptional regulator
MDSARTIFLRKGYHGTTIDEIVDHAGVSRASFYTYYPSKRDLLLALAQSTAAAIAVALDTMQAIVDESSEDPVKAIVETYLALVEDHGAFIVVWGQATFEDEELAVACTKTRLITGRRFAHILEQLVGTAPDSDDPGQEGLALLVMMESYWSYWHVNGFPFDEEQVVHTFAGIIQAVIDAWAS